MFKFLKKWFGIKASDPIAYTPAPLKRDAATILKLALKKISNPSEWRKNGLGYANGAVCALGALDYADSVIKGENRYMMQYPEPDGNGMDEALTAINGAIMKKQGLNPAYANPYQGRIYGFNDRYDTSHQDVVEVFQEALKAVEGK